MLPVLGLPTGTGPGELLLDMARVDPSGRLSARGLLAALHWDAGHRVPLGPASVRVLDVDGPLIPLRARPATSGRRSGGVGADLYSASGNPLLDRLDPQDGRRLLALDCPLVWATSWMGEANEVVAPRLGLPDLPVVEWPDTDNQPAHGLHWKTMFLTTPLTLAAL